MSIFQTVICHIINILPSVALFLPLRRTQVTIKHLFTVSRGKVEHRFSAESPEIIAPIPHPPGCVVHVPRWERLRAYRRARSAPVLSGWTGSGSQESHCVTLVHIRRSHGYPCVFACVFSCTCHTASTKIGILLGKWGHFWSSQLPRSVEGQEVWIRLILGLRLGLRVGIRVGSAN